MKVTLYIPCFNAEKYIKFCLEAVLKQSYPIEEILIIDDASTDKTTELVSQFPVKLIRHPVNKGLASVRNTAIKNAKANFLASLDADCVPERDWLQKLMRNFSSKVAGVGGRLLESYADSSMDMWRAVHMKQEWGGERSSFVSFLYGSNSVFKKENLRRLGGYKERYSNNYEDVDISQRIKKKGYALIYEPQALIYHIKEDNILSLFDTFWNWNFDFHKKRGYYKDYKNLCRKINENVGLANRFMEADYREKRLQLFYLDFLLSIHLSLKDFLFVYNKEAIWKDVKEPPPFMHYLNLVDITFFYHMNSKSKSLRTFMPHQQKFVQNFFAFLLLTGQILRSKVHDQGFLKEIFRYFISSFIKERDGFSEFLLPKMLLLVEQHKDWNDFLKKRHPNLEKQYLKVFSKNFNKWLDYISHQIPDVFNLIELSQSRLIKKRR